jgi:hypothetical protein
MKKLDKFKEVYAKIIAEEIGFNTQMSDTKKYNLTLLYSFNIEDLYDNGIIDDDEDDEDEVCEKYEQEAVNTLEKLFAPLGGKNISDGIRDVAYYGGDVSNSGSNGYPFEFNNISKDQLIKIFNVKAPYSGYDSFGDQIVNNWGEGEWDGINVDVLINGINEAKENGDYTILKFEEI